MPKSFSVRFKRVNLLCLAALVCGGIVGGTAYAATGGLDPTFAGTGKLLVSGTSTAAWDVAVQGDGKIVTAGEATGGNARVWRYNTDGSPDLGFNSAGSPGFLDVDAGGDDDALALTLAPDGKIVIGGQTTNGSDGFVARIKTDGTIDNGFGGGDGVAPVNVAGGFEQTLDVAVQSDLKIISVGFSGTGSPNNGTVTRLDSTTGAPDASCGGGDGLETIPASGNANAVALQANGDIVVAGNTNPSGNGYVARLLASNCSLDAGGYATLGKAILDSGGSEQVLGVTVQPDGKAVAVGFTSVGTNGAVYRLNTNGLPDTSFDTDGAAGVDSAGDETLQDVRVQPDGKIVTVGRTSAGGGQAAAYRLLANGGPGTLNGALDPTFDGDGAIGVDFTGSIETALGVDLQTDGKVVASGNAAGPQGFLFRLEGDPPILQTPPAAVPVATPVKKKRCKKGFKLKKVKGKKKCVKKKKKKG
jgi:uncharacterized delta-60 repeat protein